METAKKLRNQHKVINHVKALKEVNNDIQDIITQSSNSMEITNTIQINVNSIEHSAIFGKAMKKCGKLRQWKAVGEIMNLFLKSKTAPGLLEFNRFLNSMALSDAPVLCHKYFRIMTSQYSIEPDTFTIVALLKSYRSPGRNRDADLIWNNAIHVLQNVICLCKESSERKSYPFIERVFGCSPKWLC